MIDIRELAEQALHFWPVVAIEAALGSEASLILPRGVRTRRFAARLPRYLIAALHWPGRGEWGDRRSAAHAGAARAGVDE